MKYSDHALRVAHALAQLRVHHPNFQAALDGVGRIVQIGNRIRDPIGMSLIAPAGAGKSLLIECVQKNVCQWPLLTSDGVLVASLKESPTIGQIQSDLLSNLDYAIPLRTSRITNAKMFNLLVNTIAQKRIWLVALDEFHHVFLAKKDEFRNTIIDWLKRLMSEARVPVLLSGTEMLRMIESADPQLATRISSIFNLPEFSNNEEWRGILSAYVNACKDIDLSELPKSLASPIFKATQGVFRTLKALILESVMVGIDAGAAAVTKDHLKVAFERLVGPGSGKANPFA